jgi:pilus assembly protein CpaE
LANASGLRDRITFVINRFDKRITITPEKISENLRLPVDFVIPFEERIVTNSINRGLPFVVEDKTYPISKLILNLADSIKNKSQESTAVLARTSTSRR